MRWIWTLLGLTLGFASVGARPTLAYFTAWQKLSLSSWVAAWSGAELQPEWQLERGEQRWLIAESASAGAVMRQQLHFAPRQLSQVALLYELESADWQAALMVPFVEVRWRGEPVALVTQVTEDKSVWLHLALPDERVNPELESSEGDLEIRVIPGATTGLETNFVLHQVSTAVSAYQVSDKLTLDAQQEQSWLETSWRAGKYGHPPATEAEWLAMGGGESGAQGWSPLNIPSLAVGQSASWLGAFVHQSRPARTSFTSRYFLPPVASLEVSQVRAEAVQIGDQFALWLQLPSSTPPQHLLELRAQPVAGLATTLAPKLSFPFTHSGLTWQLGASQVGVWWFESENELLWLEWRLQDTSGRWSAWQSTWVQPL